MKLRLFLLASFLAFSSPGRPAAAQQTASAQAPSGAWQGVAVVVVGGATDAAWPLAQAVYADALLRPARLDDGVARVLAGEAPPPTAPASLRELGELRAALRGDDAPSRRLLGSLRRELGVSLLLVVERPADLGPRARIFRDDAFEEGSLLPDGASPPRWSAAVASLRSRAPRPEPPPAPARSKPAWKSGWFWGAVGFVASIGVIFFASRGSDDAGTIPLRARRAN